MLRKASWDLINTRGTFVETNNLQEDLRNDRSQIRHLRHCWDYLRQTVSCQSDLTLEGISPHNHTEILDIDGYHVKHQCKNRICGQQIEHLCFQADCGLGNSCKLATGSCAV